MNKKLGLTTQDLKEKAVSKAQQRYMAMVAHGKIEGPEGLSKEEASQLRELVEKQKSEDRSQKEKVRDEPVNK